MNIESSRYWIDCIGYAWLMDPWGYLIPVPNVKKP
jgi:hypothetical protein